MTTAMRTVSVALAMSVAVVVVDNETEFKVLKTFVVTRAVSQDHPQTSCLSHA